MWFSFVWFLFCFVVAVVAVWGFCGFVCLFSGDDSQFCVMVEDLQYHPEQPSST